MTDYIVSLLFLFSGMFVVCTGMIKLTETEEVKEYRAMKSKK